MLQKIKLSILVFPMVVWIGSYFVPAEFSRNSYFKEAAEIESVIHDYAEGFYEADLQKIHQSVHPSLQKIGSRFNAGKGSYEQVEEIGLNQLIEQAKFLNRDGQRADTEPIKKIVIYDVQEINATAKLTTAWGIEYVHLAKIDEKWYIMNVLWQSPQAL